MPFVTVLGVERAYKPESEWNKKALAEAEFALAKPLAVLNDQLAGRDYLLGDSFTVADLNVAAVIYPGTMNGTDLAPFANASAWFDRCTNREAVQGLVELAMAEFTPHAS